jgi:hypothetical protein
MEETIRRRRRAVAIAQGRECRICRLLSSLDIVSFQVVTTSKVSNLTHAIRVSIDCSTGSVGRDWRKEARPGVSDAMAGAIPGLTSQKPYSVEVFFYKVALEIWKFGNLAKVGDQEDAGKNSLPSSVVQCCLDDSTKPARKKWRRVSDILYSTDQNFKKKVDIMTRLPKTFS